MPSHHAPTLSLQTLLTPSHIQLGLAATSKKRIFEEIGFLFERTAKLDRSAVTDSLFARERLGSTGLGHGVAIPHGRIKGLKEPHIAMFQLSAGIGFDAVDDAPVSLLFALLVPENATQKHLDLLSGIAELLGDEAKREALKTATSAEAVLAIVNAGSLL
jgi:PTS system nitrogen regulatory IIA component